MAKECINKNFSLRPRGSQNGFVRRLAMAIPQSYNMNPTTLENTWRLREAELKAEQVRTRLEVAADLLFNSLVSDTVFGIAPRVAAIREEMDRVCRTATSRYELRVPIWSFCTRSFLKGRVEEADGFATAEQHEAWRAHRDDVVAVQGYHSAIPIPGRQHVNVRTQDVIQYTNIMDRLTVQLFGTTNFLMKCGTVDTEAMPELGIRVTTRTLFLNFYPDGLTIPQMSTLHQIARRYQTPPTSPRLTAVPPPIRRETTRYVYDDEVGLSADPRCYCSVCVAE